MTAIDANLVAFVLAVTVATSAAFLGSVGYQPNPFVYVYGSSGYKFSD